jgi:HSP20 family molecular chaperone IbpA
MSESTVLQKKEADSLEKAERTRSGKTFIPPTDIIETKDAMILIADMPGVDEKNIDITLENNQLTIQGNVEVNYPENYHPLYSEYEVGDYYRSFSLSDSIDDEKIVANYKNGVLRLTLPKAEKVKPRQIAVSTG